MKFLQTLPAVALVCMAGTASTSNSPTTNEPRTSTKQQVPVQIKEATVSYSADTVNMNGYVAYNGASENKRPVVLVIHEWWGLNDYTKSRVRQLAELGYLAFAVDFYGNGAQADNPTLAGEMATPFYKDPMMAKTRFDAALAKVKTMVQADTNNIAAIGYCFGGAQVLNIARLGSPLKGVVSFHGNLIGVPLDQAKLTANVLVCHGNADPFVPQTEVDLFKKQMDAIGATYTFKGYDNAMHAFTSPSATETGKKFGIPVAYNAAADTASWNDMKQFFGTIFK
jgi:dienelactone hydrolase